MRPWHFANGTGLCGRVGSWLSSVKSTSCTLTSLFFHLHTTAISGLQLETSLKINKPGKILH